VPTFDQLYSSRCVKQWPSQDLWRVIADAIQLNKAHQGFTRLLNYDLPLTGTCRWVYCNKEGDVGRQAFVNSNECEPQAHIVLSAFVSSRTSCLSSKDTLDYVFVCPGRYSID